MLDSIAILDFGSQFAQLIARRVREAQVYCELFPWDAPAEQIMALEPKGFILSGGPNSAYEADAPFIPDYVLASAKPILGICHGMQALTVALGGQVDPSSEREYGHAMIEPLIPGTMLDVLSTLWMSHGPYHTHAGRLRCAGEIGQQSLRGDGRFRSEVLWRAVPS